jgi:flagellar basal-body rod protein FlgG
VSFSEVLTSAAAPLNRGSANDIISTAAGVAADPSLHVFTAGELRPTGNALDLAIRGDGFIELTSESGQATLWRGGVLHVGTDGYLTAPNGLPLKAMISVPHDASGITVSATGQVQATIPNQTDPVNLGEIELVMPTDVRALQSSGDSVYSVQDDSTTVSRVRPGEDNAGTLAQGFSEASNVSLSDELVSLMLYQRAYASNARLVQAGDELMSIANGLKR